MKPPVTDPGPAEDAAAGSEAPRPMVPRDRRRLRIGHLPQAIPVRDEDDAEWVDADLLDGASRSRRQDLDPVFGYILAIALSIGLTPLQANTRYIVLWAFMAAMGGLAALLGSGVSLKVSDPGDLLWGLGLGVLTGGALMLVGADTLATASQRLFADGDGDNVLLRTWVFQATVFVMPIAESLFFRGAMQRAHPIPVVAVLASVWSMVMFFPSLGLGSTPVVGAVFGTAVVLLNFLYSYVQWRHGLASSFFCQIAAGTLLLAVPLMMAY